METYKTRKEADNVRKTNPWHNSSERIIKVEGGYALITEKEYQTWRKQK